MATGSSAARAGTVLLVALAWCAALPVQAETASGESTIEPSARAAESAVMAQQGQKGVIRGRPLTAEGLSANRGGSAVVNEMRLRGVVADNQAVNVATGNNMITEGSLSDAVGVPMVIQNTGNNVLIQNATIVNVHVH